MHVWGKGKGARDSEGGSQGEKADVTGWRLTVKAQDMALEAPVQEKGKRQEVTWSVTKI